MQAVDLRRLSAAHPKQRRHHSHPVQQQDGGRAGLHSNLLGGSRNRRLSQARRLESPREMLAAVNA